VIGGGTEMIGCEKGDIVIAVEGGLRMVRGIRCEGIRVVDGGFGMVVSNTECGGVEEGSAMVDFKNRSLSGERA